MHTHVKNLVYRTMLVITFQNIGYFSYNPIDDVIIRNFAFSDPSRHTNGDAMRAHLLTFEVKRDSVTIKYSLKN